MHIGYRKSKAGGVWLVRWRNGRGYKQEAIGTADDVIGPEHWIMTPRSAQHGRLSKLLALQKAAADGPPITVRIAVEEYIASRDARETKARRTRAQIERRRASDALRHRPGSKRQAEGGHRRTGG